MAPMVVQVRIDCTLDSSFSFILYMYLIRKSFCFHLYNVIMHASIFFVSAAPVVALTLAYLFIDLLDCHNSLLPSLPYSALALL